MGQDWLRGWLVDFSCCDWGKPSSNHHLKSSQITHYGLPKAVLPNEKIQLCTKCFIQGRLLSAKSVRQTLTNGIKLCCSSSLLKELVLEWIGIIKSDTGVRWEQNVIHLIWCFCDWKIRTGNPNSPWPKSARPGSIFPQIFPGWEEFRAGSAG